MDKSWAVTAIDEVATDPLACLSSEARTFTVVWLPFTMRAVDRSTATYLCLLRYVSWICSGLALLAVALRYQPLTPLFLALVIVERGLMSLQAWVLSPPAGRHHPPEHYASPVGVVLALVFLALSLRPRRAR